MPLFYVTELPESTAMDISGEEAGHICKAARLRIGDELTLTDGQGTRCEAKIQHILHRPIVVSVELGERFITTESKPELILASSLPKGDRQNVLLDMVTQLGIDRFIPLICERSVSKPRPNSVQRWQRVIISACKQSQRFRFPRIEQAISLNELLVNRCQDDLYLVANANAHSLNSIADALPSARKVIIMVGPEGGFSQDESVDIKESGIQSVSLGRHILRTETACVTALAALNQFLIQSGQ